ncbi:uncharacterized protein LOC142355510, partial [Convolutriloba macropyga]|uniref:uncharacterized protein LOC142355510 n=1 Tax=Convolutriloba macropyga TaxID=536237 RepID=UPI003F52046D
CCTITQEYVNAYFGRQRSIMEQQAREHLRLKARWKRASMAPADRLKTSTIAYDLRRHSLDYLNSGIYPDTYDLPQSSGGSNIDDDRMSNHSVVSVTVLDD